MKVFEKGEMKTFTIGRFDGAGVSKDIEIQAQEICRTDNDELVFLIDEEPVGTVRTWNYWFELID